jgi:hypothetical protein
MGIMNYLEVIKAYQTTPKSIGFRRKIWDESTYCYISDMDFCIYMVYGTPDEDDVFSYGPDVQATDWVIKEK